MLTSKEILSSQADTVAQYGSNFLLANFFGGRLEEVGEDTDRYMFFDSTLQSPYFEAAIWVTTGNTMGFDDFIILTGCPSQCLADRTQVRGDK